MCTRAFVATLFTAGRSEFHVSRTFYSQEDAAYEEPRISREISVSALKMKQDGEDCSCLCPESQIREWDEKAARTF